MCEYKSIPCIKKMGKGYQDIFDEMVKAYAEKLSSRIILSNSVFTLHGIIELVYIVLQSVVKPGITGFFKIDLHIKCYIYLS